MPALRPKRWSGLARWPALVLTAGLATRLQPLSSVRAKAALPVAGEALVTRILRWLHAAGIRRVVLNLHHRPESITRIVGDGSRARTSRCATRGKPRSSARPAARRAPLPLLEADRFLIVNGDTLTDCRPARARRAARRHQRAGDDGGGATRDPRYNAILADEQRCDGSAGHPAAEQSAERPLPCTSSASRR